MSQPIILNAALAVHNYGMQALIGSQVVFVSEVLGNGECTMKSGAIIDELFYIIDEPEWADSMLYVAVIENGDEILYPIFAHEQIALMPVPKETASFSQVVGGAA